MALTRNEKKLFAFCAFAICLPLCAATFIRYINATPIVAIAPIRKAPQPNGYDLYVRASNAIKEAKPSVDPNLDLKPPTDPKVRAQRYSLARKDAWLRQNKAGFDLFKTAQKAESLAPTLLPHKGQAASRQMGRYKIIESNAHWQRGDHHAALRSGLDILQLGHDVQRGGNLYDHLVGSAIASMAQVTTGDVIEHLNAQQARDAARRVEQLIANRWPLAESLSEEKSRVEQDWLKYFARADWRADFVRNHQWLSATWGQESLTWKQRILIHTTSKHTILFDLDRFFERAISNARLPYGMKGEAETAPGNPFVDATHGYLATKFLSSARSQTSDRVLMLRLALRAYQIEHGAPPRNLQALVPAYVNAVPTDPFGKGEPFRYRTDGQTYTLWSIGPDGKDDGGKPIGWFKKAPTRHADEREKLPRIWRDESLGDYVAGENH